MNGYKLIKEHDQHFEVEHPKNGVIKVAKKGLSDDLQRRIRSIDKIQHFQAGGRAKADPASADDDVPQVPNQTEPVVQEPVVNDQAPQIPQIGLGSNVGLEAAPPPPEGTNQLQQVVDTAKDLYKKSQRNLPPEKQAFPDDESPTVDVSAATPQGQGTPTAGTSAPTNPNLVGPPAAEGSTPNQAAPLGSQHSPGYAQMQSGIDQEAKARQDAAEKEAKIYDEQALKQQLLADGTQQQLGMISQKRDAMIADYQNGKVDPNRVWNNMTTGNKVLAGISLALSGLGSGLTGQDNLALKVITSSIDRDIDAQKSELGKKANLISQYTQEYRDVESASLATKLALTTTAKAQVDAVAARAVGPLAQANALKLKGQLADQESAYAYQLAQRQATLNLYGGQANAKDLSMLSPDDRKRVVTLPSGHPAMAKDEKAAEAYGKVAEAHASIDQQVQAFKRFQQEHGRTIPFSDADKEGERIQKSLILSMGELKGLTRFTGEEEKLYNNLVENPGAWRQSNATKAIDQIADINNAHLNEAAKNNLIGVNPTKVSKATTRLGK